MNPMIANRVPQNSRWCIEFDTKGWGSVQSVHLFINDATCEVKWSNGVILKTLVDASKPVGWFRFENLQTAVTPVLKAPKYQGAVSISGDPVGGDDLSRLGYPRGTIRQQDKNIVYNQTRLGWFYI